MLVVRMDLDASFLDCFFIFWVKGSEYLIVDQYGDLYRIGHVRAVRVGELFDFIADSFRLLIVHNYLYIINII